MRPTPEPSTNDVLPFPDSHFLVTNFVDPKQTTCATTFMNYVLDWGRSITASFTSFHGRTVSVIAHGLTKESAVPATDIKQAIARKAAFTANPATHTFKGEINDA